MTNRPRPGFLFLLALAVGTLAANIYYTQPIVGPIANALGIRPDAAGLIMTLTQIGYGLGVLFIVPLGDLIANKKLILAMIALAILAELGLGVSRSMAPYFLASIVAGIGGSTVQILVPYASHLYDRAERGRVIGTLMSGLMLGIMLSRPLSSLLTDLISFHAVFFVSAAVMLLLLARLAAVLPERVPESTGLRYKQLLWSMKELLFETATLRRRAVYQALMFGAFCIFWTTTPLLLTQSAFHFTQKGVALFALIGVAGAVVAPWAGRMADRGFSRQATLLAFVVGILSFGLSHFLHEGGWASLVLLAIAANLLDAGVSAHLVLGQRAIFLIDPKNQSRLNGLYVAIIYVGGSIGSALGAWAYLHGGWKSSTLVGMGFPLAALALFVTEKTFGYLEKSECAQLAPVYVRAQDF